MKKVSASRARGLSRILPGKGARSFKTLALLALMSSAVAAQTFEPVKLELSYPNPGIAGWTCVYRTESGQRFEFDLSNAAQCFNVVLYEPLTRMVSMPARRPWTVAPSPAPSVMPD
ncbi:hypothetical protein J2W27_004395 [Variovorax boronicumulans]|uniref:hypothetical protein n=1 Tax=Variovorax boronicumulans TaxID=436515 RepID=UPI00277FBA4C|nr:hypothetical protein [Variovorax boronicumulans]MDP9912269.1 hypothetical protein [Variovorax boronicumulans]